MSVDRVSNMLSSLKNAAMAGNTFIETYYTKECEGVAKVLQDVGFLSGVKVFKPKETSHKMLRMDLTQDDGEIMLSDVKRISKPGQRIYAGVNDFIKSGSGYGVTVVSTSRGIMSSDEAKRKRLGGEVICKVI